jgi:trimeric autotransporter adhesin
MQDGLKAARRRRFHCAIGLILLATLSLSVQAGAATKVSMVKDITPGSADSSPKGFESLGGILLFGASRSDADVDKLWRSDGTASGTQRIERIWPQYMTRFRRRVFFAASDASHSDELWKTDGTAAGTKLVKDIIPGGDGSYPIGFQKVGRALFFQAAGRQEPSAAQDRELWKSDGTRAGTKLVKDINPGIEGSYPDHLTNVRGTLFFITRYGSHIGLWRSDGTQAGTKLLKAISTDPGRPHIRDLKGFHGKLFFQIRGGTHGVELWKSDGTVKGTKIVKTIRPDRESNRSLHFETAGGRLFFAADDGVHGTEPWKSDGTRAGTKLLKDISRGPSQSYPMWARIAFRGKLYFSAARPGHGQGLWESDGSRAGTRLIKTIDPRSPRVTGLSLIDLTRVGSSLFFEGDDPVHGYELWKSNGTRAGTRMVVDINPGSDPHDDSSYPSSLTNVAGTLLFGADDGIHGRELWKAVP